MKIAFNPSTVAALTSPPKNKDITFDLRGRNIFARGVEFKGTDTNTWRDIKINNVSIGSNILDLRHGSNTTLTNSNGVVTINSTWRPVVDSLTSDSTTSSLSANQGRVLAGLINGKSDSDHNHDDRYLKLTGGTMSGTIYRNSGGATISGRDHAIIRQTYAPGGSSWNPIACVDTETGTWTLGHLSNGDSDTRFSFCFSTNVDYNAGYNQGNYVHIRNIDGTLALTSEIPNKNSWNYDDRYVRYYAVTTLDCNNLAPGLTAARVSATNAARSGHSTFLYISDVGTPFQIQIPDSSEPYIYKRCYGSGRWNGWFKLSAGYADSAGSVAWDNVTNKPATATRWPSWDEIANKPNTFTPSGHNHDGRYVYNYGGTRMDGGSLGKNALGMTTNSGVTGDWWHILQAAWDGEYRWNSQIAFPTQNRNGMYYRSGLDDNTKWGSWVKLLDSNNYSSILDIRYITDITTSVNKLTFTRNGSNIDRTITVNNVQSQGQLPDIADQDNTTKADSGLYIYDSYGQTLGTNNYSAVLSINTGGTIQIAGNWGDDHARNLYWRSQSDRAVTSYPWKSWRTILDSENYAGILDSRYYTEAEVNSLLDGKLNRQNLSYGIWNPRGYNLAADYFYNGGDLSISETGGQIHVSVDGYFWQNEGRYRVLDTSDIAGLKADLTVYQYLSNTDTTWFPLIWGGNSHNNTSDSTGAVYKSHDRLSWQTSSQTLYATNIQTENIKRLSIGGGIFWNPYVESATDSTDAASITLVKSGVAGGTTLVLSQMNDSSDTIQFKTNTVARLYHNSYPILTTQNTYVNNNKGYINGTEITQVNNADTLDGAHLIRYGNGTGIKQVYYFHPQGANTSYIKLGTLNTVAVTGAGSSKVMFTVKGGINFGGTNESVYEVAASTRGSIQVTSTLVRGNRELKFGYVSTSSNVEIWMAYDGTYRGVTEVEVSSSISFTLAMTETTTKPSGFVEGSYRILASTADNVTSATKLQTARKIWGQSFDGTADVDNTLRIRKTPGNYCEGIRIQTGDGAWSTIILGATADSGTNTNAWSIHRKIDNNFAISRNSSDGRNGLVMTSIGMGLGTISPTQRLDVAGNIRTTGDIYITHGANNNMNYNTSNPRIVFSENGYQAVGLVYTDYDSYRPSKGLKVMDTDNVDAGNVWFEVQGYNYSSGYVKNGGNKNQLLRADGEVAGFNWAGQSGQPTWLWGGNDFNSYYVYNPSNFRVAYAASAGNAEKLGGMPKNYGQSPFGTIPCVGDNGVMEIGRYIDYHYDNSGSYDFSTRLQTTGNYANVVSLPSASGTLALTSDIDNYYWANVKISTTSSTATSPTVSSLTATSSIRAGNIRLERTNEINSSDNLFLNYGSSSNISLCNGGGKVGIGITLPTQKLDVRGNIITNGFGIQPYYLSKSGLLPTISPGDGYTYKCLEISATTEISCIMADGAGLMNERGILIKFNQGFDGQVILLKDLSRFGTGNDFFWVQPYGCRIIKADSSNILIGQNQISNTYDDGRSRFFVYASRYYAWIEFLCSNIS